MFFFVVCALAALLIVSFVRGTPLHDHRALIGAVVAILALLMLFFIAGAWWRPAVGFR